MHDPRAYHSQGLAYATAARGADHNKNDAYQVDSGTGHPDLELEITDRFADDKAASVEKGQNFRAMTDNLGICHFAQVPFKLMIGMVNAATGWNTTVDELLKAGERTFQLQRALSCKLGVTAKDDVLPELALRPIPDSGQEGHVPNMGKMMPEYYALRDWDAQTGKPSRKRLESLNMPEIAASIKAL
jgi:aldehyde:ferredoxin oxidoreductase